MPLQPSPQQQAFLSALHSNESLTASRFPRRHLAIDALAGTGKSTTCRLGMNLLSIEYGRSIAYAMLTKQTVEDYRTRFGSPRTPDIRIETAHRFGLDSIRLKHSRVTIDKNKPYELFGSIWTSSTPQATRKRLEKKYRAISQHVTSLSSFAKDRLLVPDSPDSDFLAIINHFTLDSPCDDFTQSDYLAFTRALLQASLQQQDVVDFDDMLYHPLIHNYPFPKYDYVFVDEAQDTNLARRELYLRMLKPWGAMVIVGDQHQAIYGFAGADSDSMDSFKAFLNNHREGLLSFPLTTCYRCPKVVIEKAQEIVPAIQCGVDTSGAFLETTYFDFLSSAPEANLDHESAILCRFNAPLAMCCFALLRRGVQCRIEGRDIGQSLIALINRLGQPTPELLIESLDRYRTQEIRKATADEARIALINDKCDTLLVFLQLAVERRATVDQVKEKIKQIFTDKTDTHTPQVLTLSTIHKAKGQEWPIVHILGPQQFMPSPFAKSPWEHQQEQNLIYVARTRSQHTLIHINEVPQ